MTDIDADLIKWIDDQTAKAEGAEDIITKHPEFSVDDAYCAQLGLMDGRVTRGARIVGYKAAHTSLAIQQEQQHGLTVGTLLNTIETIEGTSIALKHGIPTFAEPEIAVLLKRDLHGPSITVLDAYHAIEGVLPAIEVVTPARGQRKRSSQMSIAIGKSEGSFVLGSTVTSLSGLDLRLEGIVVSVNGVPKRSGTGVEAMGNPLNVIVAVTELLAKYGRGLKAGMVVMTGSITNNIAVAPGDEVCVETTRLGAVTARFSR